MEENEKKLFLDFETNYGLYSNITEDIKPAFAEGLMKLRKHTGLSILEVGSKTNIPFQHISKYEKGETEPSMTRAQVICNFFLTSIIEMLGCYLDGTDIEDEFDEHINYIISKNPKFKEPLKERFPKYFEE